MNLILKNLIRLWPLFRLFPAPFFVSIYDHSEFSKFVGFLGEYLFIQLPKYWYFFLRSLVVTFVTGRINNKNFYILTETYSSIPKTLARNVDGRVGTLNI
jgi:hypothetical protein